eukprot:CAMPEP_0201510056 /NCGR_PEP_ID=MMETSP0161_2-20130828/2908_1 /ASSEMBLY_ACC=CAM_ASM_000251 /TAXON_ID=180227 /ORGANISM="Neoparamoeba aestuarina, Strain SoJaBio B1-5/56/2" /LENGTH=246 /DNA_ID=CAMNT_0047905173 /DNA_START=1 /DNA_END=741 /DNA_ORIENTATION=-
MKRTFHCCIQSFWGGSGLSKESFVAQVWRVLQQKVPLRGVHSTCFIDIRSDSTFALHVLKKISLERVSDRQSTLDGLMTPDCINSLSQSGSYLLSLVVHDIDKLRKSDWTIELDPLWMDQAINHRNLYKMLYEKNSEASDARQAFITDFALKYFEDMVQVAFQTEAAYSKIFYAKFHMQRSVRDPVEREKILLRCAEVFEEFKSTVPAEYSKKAIAELQWQLAAIRHWVSSSGCENAKRLYSRILA